MDYQALATLVATFTDYASTDDQTIADWCNEEAITVDSPTLSSGTIFAACLNNVTEWENMPAADREIVKDILYIHSGEGVPTAVGTPARSILVAKLGTNTKAELAAAISKTISRAENAGVYGVVKAGDINYARSLI